MQSCEDSVVVPLEARQDSIDAASAALMQAASALTDAAIVLRSMTSTPPALQSDLHKKTRRQPTPPSDPPAVALEDILRFALEGGALTSFVPFEEWVLRMLKKHCLINKTLPLRRHGSKTWVYHDDSWTLISTKALCNVCDDDDTRQGTQETKTIRHVQDTTRSIFKAYETCFPQFKVQQVRKLSEQLLSREIHENDYKKELEQVLRLCKKAASMPLKTAVRLCVRVITK